MMAAMPAYYEAAPMPADGDLPALEAYVDDFSLARCLDDWKPTRAAAAGPAPYWPEDDGSGVAALLDSEPRPVSWLVKNKVPHGRAIGLTGIGGVSKTRCMFQIGIGAVTSRTLWGWAFERTGAAALFLTEDTADDAHRKLHEIKHAMNLTDAEGRAVRQKLKIFPLASVSPTTLLEAGPGGTLHESERAAGLFRRCKSIPDLVFIGLDPSLSLTEGAELDQSNQRQLGKLVDRLAIETGATVMLVSHAAKSLQTAEEINSHSSRGAGSLTDALRAEYVLRGMTAAEARQLGVSDIENRKGYVQLVATKGNDLPPSAFVPIWLRRGTAGVLELANIEPADGADVLHKRDTDALGVLRRLNREGTFQFSDWLAALLAEGTIKGQTEAAKKTLQRIVRVLLAHGLIERGPIRGTYQIAGDSAF